MMKGAFSEVFSKDHYCPLQVRVWQYRWKLSLFFVFLELWFLMFSKHNFRNKEDPHPPSKKSCIQQWINPLKKADGVRPVSPSPASSASSLAAPPGPRPHAASRSSTRPAAHSACSSWGCPSSDQRCEPSDANKERGKKKPSQPPCHHILEMLKTKRQLEKVLFFWF